MPAAGDVDILIAAEMMEAGRAILRGFVTPDRTVLIASTHRVLAVSEKSVPATGWPAPKRRWPQPRSPRAACWLAISTARRSRPGRSSRPASSARWPPRARCPSRARPSRRRSAQAVRASRVRSAPSRPGLPRPLPRARCPKPRPPRWPRPRRAVRRACWRNGLVWPTASRAIPPRCARWQRRACARSSSSRTPPMAPTILRGSMPCWPATRPRAITC